MEKVEKSGNRDIDKLLNSIEKQKEQCCDDMKIERGNIPHWRDL